jgi:Outer membrane lipoprotein-sorting protein
MTPARIAIVLLLVAVGAAVAAAEQANWTGQQIMQAVHVRQQQFPYVYEEQSIVLMDRSGARDTRKARRYSRIEDDGSVRLLVIFESPPDVRGLALLAARDAAGAVTQGVYLPALGQRLVDSANTGGDGGFMGTDFSVESLTGELPQDYLYMRGDDLEIDNQPYFTVDVFVAGSDPRHGQPLRRHFVRQDNFFITRTEHFGTRGEVVRRQRAYDLKVVDGTHWHANLMLMEDLREHHQTLIKVDRRVYSRDYVPVEMFSAAWLFENYPLPATQDGADDMPVAGRGPDL